MPDARRQRSESRRQVALARIRAVAARAGVAGVVLTRPGPVAWASGGMNPPVDRTAALDTVWLAVGPERTTVITTEVERPRIVAELAPPEIDVVAVPWWDADAFAVAACEVLDAPTEELGSDGHPAFGRDLDHELAVVRVPLSEPERAELRLLGEVAAGAVEDALRRWEPGEPDHAIAARIAEAVERGGADAPCLLVGGDERLARFRHPVACGDRPRSTVMAVLVARSGGLHVALTRHVAAREDAALEAGIAVCRAIHRTVLAAAGPGATYGAVMTTLDAAYATARSPGGWHAHYQGGPIGYGQREFEIAPAQSSSPWWDERIEPGVALAFNPSLPGGAKDEDTFLVGADGGLELVTTTGDWPAADDDLPPRPAMLRVRGYATPGRDRR